MIRERPRLLQLVLPGRLLRLLPPAAALQAGLHEPPLCLAEILGAFLQPALPLGELGAAQQRLLIPLRVQPALDGGSETVAPEQELPVLLQPLRQLPPGPEQGLVGDLQGVVCRLIPLFRGLAGDQQARLYQPLQQGKTFPRKLPP